MKKLFLILSLCAALLLSACSAPSPASEQGKVIQVYRPLKPEYQSSGPILESHAIPVADDTDPLRGAIYALNAMPDDSRLSSPFSGSVRIISAKRNGSVCEVFLNSDYSALAGMEKTILDYCIVLTMCSVEGVESVDFYVGGELVSSDLRADDVILRNTVESASAAELRLYFPSLSGKLRSEYRLLSLEDESSPERAAIDALLAGPESDELFPALPEGTVLLSVYTQDGVCSVSLSESFTLSCAEQPEISILWVYSLVNTLCSLSSVNSVRILIDGKTADSVGNCNISVPLTKNERLTGSPIMG